MHYVRTRQEVAIFHGSRCKGILLNDVTTGQGIAVFHGLVCKGILVHGVKTR